MKRTFILCHDTARQRAVQTIQASPDGYVVTIDDPQDDTIARLHAVVKEVTGVEVPKVEKPRMGFLA